MTEAQAADARRYSLVAIVLHWVIAALIVLQVALAGRMEGRTPEAFAVFQLHKSVGITVLLLSLARLGWRFANPMPPRPADLAPWERRLADTVQWGFYVVMIGMPLTGWIMVSASRIAVPTLLFGVVPWPHLPGLPDLAEPAKHAWREAGEVGHSVIIKLGYVMLALHVAGALKHQLFGHGEPFMARVAPGARAGWAEPRLLVILAAFVGVVVFGRTVQPPRPHMSAAPPPPAAAAPVEAPAAPAAPAEATPAAPEAPAEAAAPVAWKVLPGSTLSFATSWGGDAIEGRFDRWTADILFSPDALEGSKVTVSIDTTSVNTGDAQRDESLPSGDWFDAAAHPKAVFTATRFEKKGEGRFVAHGRLSLRGVTRPLDLPFRLKIAGDRAEVSGVTSLDRTAFGVGQGEWRSTDQIPGKVSVTIALKAQRK